MMQFKKILRYVGIFLKYLSLVFFSFVAILPIVSCVITAFKTDAEYQSTNVMVMPESWFNFSNFIDAFQRANMGRAFINSTIVLLCVLVVSTLVGTQLAYILNRFMMTITAATCISAKRRNCSTRSVTDKPEVITSSTITTCSPSSSVCPQSIRPRLSAMRLS